MAHWQTMFDPGEYIGNWDLPHGEDTIVTISKVECRQLGNKGTKEKKPIIIDVSPQYDYVTPLYYGDAGLRGFDDLQAFIRENSLVKPNSPCPTA